MNQKLLLSIAIVSLLTGCASVRDGLFGRYHKYDSREYEQTVLIVEELRSLESNCGNQAVALQITHDVNKRMGLFVAYAQGRPHNQRIVSQAKDLQTMLTDTEDRTAMSEYFCKERAKNLVRGAQILQTTSGSKPE